MIGMERNSDIVKMASYAPLFEHFNMAEWSVSILEDRQKRESRLRYIFSARSSGNRF